MLAKILSAWCCALHPLVLFCCASSACDVAALRFATSSPSPTQLFTRGCNAKMLPCDTCSRRGCRWFRCCRSSRSWWLRCRSSSSRRSRRSVFACLFPHLAFFTSIFGPRSERHARNVFTTPTTSIPLSVCQQSPCAFDSVEWSAQSIKAGLCLLAAAAAAAGGSAGTPRIPFLSVHMLLCT